MFKGKINFDWVHSDDVCMFTNVVKLLNCNVSDTVNTAASLKDEVSTSETI